MIITRSPALREFKKQVGQANHFLITILVGLDGVADKKIGIKEEFHATWDPKDPAISASQSKKFARKSSLAWTVDCLDMYLRLVNRNPTMISDVALKHDIDAEDNRRSVYRRLMLICQVGQVDDIHVALADVLICWRNRLTHYDADNDIANSSRNLLLDNKDFIKEEYNGLDIELTLESFDSKRSPTFKEVASLISASVKLVNAIDRGLIAKLDSLSYADRVILNYLKQNESKMLNEVFSNENKKIEKSLRQILMQHGFIIDNTENSIDTFCVELSTLDIKELQKRLSRGTLLPN